MYQIDFLVLEFGLTLDVTGHRHRVYNFENLLKIQVQIACGSDNAK